MCGTPEYLAPELLLGKGYNKSVDYWAVGVLIFEMLVGHSPFADSYGVSDQMAIYCKILECKLRFPRGFKSAEMAPARALISKLLTRQPHKRLGCLRRGALDIKKHAWFDTIDWAALVAKKLEAPWRPPIKDPLDASNFDKYDEDEYGTRCSFATSSCSLSAMCNVLISHILYCAHVCVFTLRFTRALLPSQLWRNTTAIIRGRTSSNHALTSLTCWQFVADNRP